MKEVKRDYAIDLMKLWGILLVMAGHCLRRYVGNDFLNTYLNNFIFIAEMPIFFFAGGFVATKVSKLNRWDKWLWCFFKKALWYFWPIITYGLIRSYAMGQYADFPDAFYHFMNNPLEGLWFFWVYFWVVTFFDLGTFLGSFFKNKTIQALSPLLTSAIFYLTILIVYENGGTDGFYLGTELALRYGGFFYIGYGVSLLYKSAFVQTKTYQRIALGVYFVALFGYVFVAFWYPSVFAIWNTISSPVDHTVRFFSGLCAALVSFFQARFLVRYKVFRFFSYGGRFTAESYWAQPNLILWWPKWSTATLALSYLSGFALLGLVILFIGLSLAILYWIPFAHFVGFMRPFSRYAYEKKALSLFE